MRAICIALLVVLCSFTETDCDQITRTVDKFTDDITFQTPNNDIVFYKSILGGKPDSEDYFIQLFAVSDNLTILDPRGVIILLSDGTKLKFPDTKIRYTPRENILDGYIVDAFIMLKKEEVEKLRTFNITDYRLYTHTMEYGAGDRLVNMINCMIPMK